MLQAGTKGLPRISIGLAICVYIDVSVGYNLFANRKGELERPSYPTSLKGNISHMETQKL